MADERGDDRPKKSWREIDSQRDKSTHRPGGAGGGGGQRPERLERSQAYRSYKTQLNKLFDGGALPEALKSKLEDSGVAADAKRKKELTQAVLSAGKPKDVRAALAELKAAFGFPEDEELLGKLLDLDDEAIALEAMGVIEKLRAAGQLKRGQSLKARIRTAQMTIDSAKVQQAARELLGKL
jgi:hypothetical protein